MRRVVSCALVLVLGACKHGDAAPAEGGDEDEHKPVAVVCEPVAIGVVDDRVTLRGVVGVPPDKDAIVAPAVAGRVLEMKVHEGDRVKVGDALATVDDPALAPAVREAEAARGAAEAAKANADATLARAKRLVDQGIAPRRDVEDAQAKAATAAADVAAAEARRDVAVRQRDRAHVTAPIAGVVVHVLRRAGELVDGTPATPVVEIADPVSLELRADAPAASLVRIRDGAVAEIALDALPGTPLTGKVVLVSPAVDPATSLGGVRVAIDALPADADVQLKLGLAGVIRVKIASRPGVITVPASAVRRSMDGGEEVVACEQAGADDKKEDKKDEKGEKPEKPGEKPAGTVAAVKPVKVGARSGDRVEIAEGLTAGERIVVRHVVGLDDGTPLEVEKP